MPVMYKKKIVEAFRDNAIKSVLLIDDEYLPYEQFVYTHQNLMWKLDKLVDSAEFQGGNELEIFRERLSSLTKAIDFTDGQVMNTDTAREFVEFFHEKQLICDVENQTDSLDKDKVRKSDLIVLDYHLQKRGDNPAERSLNLISELSDSKHMNTVVVYTAEPLGKVWFEIAAALRGTHCGDVTEFLKERELINSWQQNEDTWKNEWQLINSKEIEAKYLTDELNVDELVTQLQEACAVQGYEEPLEKHVQWLLEKRVQDLNKNNLASSKQKIHGKRDLWLQAGDIFVVLSEKKKLIGQGKEIRDVTPEEVWEQIKAALESWYPSFYRVVTSELQNQIEDANLSMEKVLAKGHMEQIATLWGVLRVHNDNREQAVKELLKNLLNDVVDKVQSNVELLQFVDVAATNVADPLPSYGNTDPTKNKEYLQNIIISAHGNQKGLALQVDKEFRCNVVHAYNEQMSTEKELPNHISTGVVLKERNNDGQFYVCIAPSCNTVPNQISGLIVERMTPHRPMRFIKLKTKKLVDSLEKAHQSDIIFVRDGDERLALSIFEKGALPTIEQGVVLNHDSQLIDKGKAKEVQFLETNPQSKELEVVTKHLQPIAKLRPGFASRYQNSQFLYEARIGVDLVSANMK